MFLPRLRELVGGLLHGLCSALCGLLRSLWIARGVLHLLRRGLAVLAGLLAPLRATLRIGVAQSFRQVVDVARERLVLPRQPVGSLRLLRCGGLT